MPVGEVLEVLGEYQQGVPDLFGLLHRLELDYQALAQVPGSHSRRFEFLYYGEQLLHFFRVGLDSCPEGKVIHETVQVAPEVAVVVQAAYDEGGDHALVLVQVPEAELFHKTLGETLLDGEGVVLRALVLAVVVDLQLVGRNRIILVEL